MKGLRRGVAAILLGALFLPLPALAAPKLSLGPRVGYLWGESSYAISFFSEGDVYRSKLEWPLDGWSAGAALGLGGERWNLELKGLALLGGKSGLMEDSDWVNGHKFVFSTSRNEVHSPDSFLLDLRGSFDPEAFSAHGASLIAGVSWERFSFTASDVDQFSPLGLEGFDTMVEGDAVSYRSSWLAGYLGGGLALRRAHPLTISAEATAGLARVSDRDDHLLRDKLSEGSGWGTLLGARITGRWAFAPSWLAVVELEGRALRAWGEQDQLFYAGEFQGEEFEAIEEKMESLHLLLSARLQWNTGGMAR